MWLEGLEAMRKCSAAVVGLDLVLGLSMVSRCSLMRSFKSRLVSPLHRISVYGAHLNQR